MIRLPFLLSLLIGVNLLAAGIFHGWVYDSQDKYRYEQEALLSKKTAAKL